MTEIEAIEDIRENVLPCVGGKSLVIAINAIEKQVPKKPKTDDRYIMYICPCCNDFIKVSHNYCTNCGQKLDWESDEE